MKKIIGRILKTIGILLLIHIVGILGWRLLYGRNWTSDQVWNSRDLPYDEAIKDGLLDHEEIAIHYAPQIDQAVNVLLSAGGRGDFITAVNYDGDWSCLNNWENLTKGDLRAAVYYSVQETDTHYYVGYYFYHPRDDAEIWLDMHENDLEGIMLAVPKSAEGYLPPEYMYTQGHGLLPFYYDAELPIALESRKAGGLLLDGDRVCIYITPNGTLDYAGHSVESALEHSTYWSVGNSGVRYVYGGAAETPSSWNGPFENNICSYDLYPLEELWAFRNGPYDGTGVFGQYGAFDGDNPLGVLQWGEDKANPPWAWRNKTIYGFGGSFLSDPVWTFNRAISGVNLSANYLDNKWADWKLTFGVLSIPATVKVDDVTLHLIRDGWEFSNPAWFTLEKGENGFHNITLCGGERNVLWVAAPAGGAWKMEIRDKTGNVVNGAFAAVTAEYLQ